MNRRIKKKQFRKNCVSMTEQLNNYGGICLMDGRYLLFDIKSCSLEFLSDNEDLVGSLDVCFKDYRRIM